MFAFFVGSVRDETGKREVEKQHKNLPNSNATPAASITPANQT
jgi:hypothetical protein